MWITNVLQKPVLKFEERPQSSSIFSKAFCQAKDATKMEKLTVRFSKFNFNGRSSQFSNFCYIIFESCIWIFHLNFSLDFTCACSVGVPVFACDSSFHMKSFLKFTGNFKNSLKEDSSFENNQLLKKCRNFENLTFKKISMSFFMYIWSMDIPNFGAEWSCRLQ